MISPLFISLCSAWFGSSVLRSHSLSGIFSLSHRVMQQDSVYLRVPVSSISPSSGTSFIWFIRLLCLWFFWQTRFLMQRRVLVISGGLKAGFMEFGIGLARPIVLKCSCRYLLHVGFKLGSIWGFSILLKRGLSWVRVEGGGKGSHGFRGCCSIPFDWSLATQIYLGLWKQIKVALAGTHSSLSSSVSIIPSPTIQGQEDYNRQRSLSYRGANVLYEVRPSQNDLAEHMPLIREALKCEDSLAKSKFALRGHEADLYINNKFRHTGTRWKRAD